MVYVGADGIGVPIGWNAGSWKKGGGVGADPELAGAAQDGIGLEPTLAAAKAAALLAAAANGSGWK